MTSGVIIKTEGGLRVQKRVTVRIRKGSKYWARVNGQMTIVKVVNITKWVSPLTNMERVNYHVENVATGRLTVFRDSFRFTAKVKTRTLKTGERIKIGIDPRKPVLTGREKKP